MIKGCVSSSSSSSSPLQDTWTVAAAAAAVLTFTSTTAAPLSWAEGLRPFCFLICFSYSEGERCSSAAYITSTLLLLLLFFSLPAPSHIFSIAAAAAAVEVLLVFIYSLLPVVCWALSSSSSPALSSVKSSVMKAGHCLDVFISL